MIFSTPAAWTVCCIPSPYLLTGRPRILAVRHRVGYNHGDECKPATLADQNEFRLSLEPRQQGDCHPSQEHASYTKHHPDVMNEPVSHERFFLVRDPVPRWCHGRTPAPHTGFTQLTPPAKSHLLY